MRKLFRSLLGLFGGCSGDNDISDVFSGKGAGDDELLNILRDIRHKYKVPAMAAAVVNDKGLQKVATFGTRKWGTDIPVTLDDKWHLGSDTKAMTGTLVALLVQEGKLTWNTTVSQVFPELVKDFEAGFRDVSMLQLLSHQAGLPDNLDYAIISKVNPVREQRLQAVRMAFSSAPLSTPGTKSLYSNIGYIVAGAVIERITNMDWETAIIRMVFEPLGMTNVGFGGLGTPGLIDQPWGHYKAKSPVEINGPDCDNPPVLGPAGRVHCTIQNWALFIRDQLRGARGEAGLLKPETYQVLQSAHFNNDYALGWVVVERKWAGGAALTHSGSNTMNFANVWISPEKLRDSCMYK